MINLLSTYHLLFVLLHQELAVKVEILLILAYLEEVSICHPRFTTEVIQTVTCKILLPKTKHHIWDCMDLLLIFEAPCKLEFQRLFPFMESLSKLTMYALRIQNRISYMFHLLLKCSLVLSLDEKCFAHTNKHILQRFIWMLS